MPETPPTTAEITDKSRLERFGANPFLDGPTEFLVKVICEELLKVPQWKAIFGECVDPYMREDYGIRSFPALRVYNKSFRKDAENWFISGDIQADVIWPASIRRKETQALPDTICAALLQQFRRPSFYTAIGARVPGLNELGKIFEADKSLGFQWQDEVVPLTQITLNFKVDLRTWDDYLESDDRTKDDPFVRTLGDLKLIVGTIQALRDDDTVDNETLVTIPTTP